MLKPFFSIIIPVFNRSNLIKPAIESVIAQSYENWEIVIVDDASTDDTVCVINKYCESDSRIKLIRHPVNKERGAARNTGIDHSTGSYICFLDSDDTFCDNHLQTFFNEILAYSEPSMFFTNSYLSIDDEKGVKKYSKTEKEVPSIELWNKFSYLLKYTPNPARVCVSRSILDKFRFHISISGLEDFDLWLRIATQYPVKHIQKYTNNYFVHVNSYSQGDINRFKKELKNFRIIFNKPILKNVLPFWGKRRL